MVSNIIIFFPLVIIMATTLYTPEDLHWSENEPTFATNGDYKTPPKGWSKKDWQEYLDWCKAEKHKAVPSGFFNPNGDREEYLWSPTKLNNYEKAQFVMANGPAMIDGSLCDVYSASAMVQVYEALSEKNRQKFNKWGFAGAHEVSFRALNRAKTRG